MRAFHFDYTFYFTSGADLGVKDPVITKRQGRPRSKKNKESVGTATAKKNSMWLLWFY